WNGLLVPCKTISGEDRLYGCVRRRAFVARYTFHCTLLRGEKGDWERGVRKGGLDHHSCCENWVVRDIGGVMCILVSSEAVVIIVPTLWHRPSCIDAVEFQKG
ncbi:hypothetical protein M758_3G042600, partial [Ceratodon purpureus]